MFAFYVLRIVARGLRLLSAKCQAVIKCTNQVWTSIRYRHLTLTLFLVEPMTANCRVPPVLTRNAQITGVELPR